jgi:hypothetical protein
MARSNGPAARNGGQASQWQQTSEQDPSPQTEPHASGYSQGWTHQLPDHPHGYFDPAGGGQHPAAAAQQPGYHYPEGVPTGGPGHYPAQGGHGHYASAPSPAQSCGSPFEQYLNDQAQGAASYASAQHQQTPEAAPASLQDQLRQASHYQQWQGHPDYDLGSYMPAQSRHGQHQAGYGHPAVHGRGPQHEPHWPDQDGLGPQGYDPHGYYPEGASGLPVTAQMDTHDDGEYEDEEAPSGKRRGLLILVSLVGAIAVGGGLAYAYKTILGPSPKGTPPVIKADNRPTKIQPSEPGGKQFAHSDMKLMGRLESTAPSAPTSNAPLSAPADPDSGVRRVSTVTIGRDGTITAPPPESRLPPPSVSVPGLTLVETGRPVLAARSPETLRAVTPPPPSNTPAAPQIISRTPPAAPAVESENGAPQTVQPVQKRQAAATPPPQPAVAAPAVSQAPKAPARRASEEPAAAPAPKSSGSTGYVAVLSSQKTRMDALKSFADLQQKYASVLQNKIPDVQEADLSARGLGTMYRAVVGPPGSREAANDICGQLKSAGYTGCWVTPY